MIQTSERGLYDQNNNRVLICPSSEQVNRIKSIPKVSYVTSVGDVGEVLPTNKLMDGERLSIFHSRILSPLQAALYADEVVKTRLDRVEVRGTACSLEGELTIKYQWGGEDRIETVRSIEQIVSEGTDSGDRTTATLPLNQLSGWPSDYLHIWPQSFRSLAGVFGSENLELPVFPVLLVYDTKDLVMDEKHKYRIENSKRLLRAFVSDYSTSDY